MTDDRRSRIYEDGEMLRLPSLRSWRLCGKTPEEDVRPRVEYQRRNPEVAEVMLAKGFRRSTPAPKGEQPATRANRGAALRLTLSWNCPNERINLTHTS